MENAIHLSRDGQTYGPYSVSQIRDLIRSGHASLEDDAWKDGMTGWQPLRSLLPPTPPAKAKAPAARAAEEVILQEPGILISRSKIQLGSSVFAPDRIGGVSITQEERRVVFPMIGLIIFGLMTISGFFGMMHEKDKGPAFIVTFSILLPITLWCAHRCFAPLKLTLMVAASGGLQSALVGTDRDRMNRIAAAIQKAILVLVILFTTHRSLMAQESAPSPQPTQEELHLLVVKVDEKGVLADKMEPHENATARRMKATGNPLASGMLPPGVNRAALGAALEPDWRISGTLIFVKGEFPGIAEGDRKVVKAVRKGSCKITSQKDGEVKTIALYEM